MRDGVVWVVNRTESTLTHVDAAKSAAIDGEIPVPRNPSEIAAYRGALWVSCLTDGKIARVTGPGG